MDHIISNNRHKNETFEAYKQRQRDAHKFIKRYLTYGIPAIAARCKRWRSEKEAWCFYAVGPLRTHHPTTKQHVGTLYKYHDLSEIEYQEGAIL